MTAVTKGGHEPNNPICENNVLKRIKLIPRIIPPNTFRLIPPDLA
jgi:hypothetical protein